MAAKNSNNEVRKAPGFRGFDGQKRGFLKLPAAPVRTVPMDGLMTAIFAPDPNTGMPRSDLHIQLAGSLDPTTQEYIRRTLARPLPSVVGHDSPDVVLDTARAHNESVNDYVQRLAAMVEEGGK